jgi:hypothetical protein
LAVPFDLCRMPSFAGVALRITADSLYLNIPD